MAAISAYQSERLEFAIRKLNGVTHAICETYSAGQKKRYKCCFMKQKYQFQMDVAQCRNVTTPLSTRSINTTHQHFQMRYVTLC